MKLFDVYPINDINIVCAEGSRVWDDQGQRYLDLYGGHAVISIGHTHPHWVRRIEEQLRQIAFYSNSVRIPIQQALADKLGEVSGRPHYQLFLINSGAEANENALKLASFHTGRKKIVAFQKAFHGRTSLAVAATDNPAIVAPVNETEHVTFLPFNDEAALDAYFREHGADTAAVIIEAIQGVGGITVASDSFLQAIRRHCTESGALFIADEVQCGYGRSGKFFTTDWAGVDADIYTMAKGMGNGFPVGGILVAPHIAPKHGMLGTTFGGNHLACAAGLGVLEVIAQEDLLQQAAENGAYLVERLQAMGHFENVRGKGLMIGFDLPAPLKDLRKHLLMEQHIFTGEAKPNVVRLLPALNITRAEIDEFLAALAGSVHALTATSTNASLQP
ncbi:aspartate aminotransferase family protein [Flaviaesturariibacter amylovorans]|uniref:Aminotransferase class III-fold pyridoxal phosphate-dependent enzyme n=1 Tax=Flaviaesturariibacter amylovorans TaxID=1084520 RepID=A0ABP8GJU9_9BACT